MVIRERMFWRLCRWAAIAVLFLSIMLALQIALAEFNVLTFNVANGGCANDKGVYTCRGFFGAAVLSAAFVAPYAVLFSAFWFSAALLSGDPSGHFGWVFLLGLLSATLLVLGCAGLLRALVVLATPWSSGQREIG
jgi:hypothetical protein